MRRPFSLIGAILLLLVAAVHIYRAYSGMGADVEGHAVPMMVSYVFAAVFGIVGLLMLMELRK